MNHWINTRNTGKNKIYPQNQKATQKTTQKHLLLAAAAFTTLSLTGCNATASPLSTQPSPETVAASPSAAQTVPALTVTPAGNNQNIISVNSSETVTVVPDIAQVVYAVRTEAKDAAGCQQKNTEDVSQVISLLTSLGVAESSIQTSDYYMYPIYNYSNNTQRITGYEATTSLTVSGLPIGNLGNILTESVNAGINNIQSITYQSSKYDEGYTEALKLAVTSAHAKAAALAEAGGCTIGKVAAIHENSNYSEARYTDNALSSMVRASGAMKEMAKMEDAVNIMPGEVDIEVNITVEYFIQ